MASKSSVPEIPFIRQVDAAAAPFADLRDRGVVDDPTRMLAGWTGRMRRPRLAPPAPGAAGAPGAVEAVEVELEAAVGRYLTSPAALLQVLAERRRAVAALTVDGVNFDAVVGTWNGTGFLVGRNLLLTNHHVLHSVEAARKARVQFNYEISPENLQGGDPMPPAAQTFALDPERLFVTSPTRDGLDYTFVWIEDAAAQAFGVVPMMRSSFTVNKGDLAFVVHHPDGEPMQVSLDDTDIVGIETTVIHYASDTMGGSSGAPVFDRRGRLIALHHASRKVPTQLEDGSIVERINEGIKIAAIALDLETRARRGGAGGMNAEAILKEIKGSDTMAGFFGGHGRQIAADMSAAETVVATYRGTDQDIDLGFWNLDWLATRWDQPAKLDGAAKVIVDLNLDAWGLVEILQPAVQALVERIRAIYGEHYEYALSDAPADEPATAMIWKRTALRAERVPWPSQVGPLFREGHVPGGERANGRIFDRCPAAFRLETAPGLAPYSFFAVPLHLKALDEGGLRRRLAARILARALEDLAAEGKADVILGGDMNAPLASADFSAIEDKGFLVLGAQDEKEGAFSYVRAPRSTVDNVFLSPTMRQTVGKADYFIVAKDRTMPSYQEISDHRPVAVRLSLASGPLPDRKDLDAMIADMLKRGEPARERLARERLGRERAAPRTVPAARRERTAREMSTRAKSTRGKRKPGEDKR